MAGIEARQGDFNPAAMHLLVQAAAVAGEHDARAGVRGHERREIFTEGPGGLSDEVEVGEDEDEYEFEPYEGEPEQDTTEDTDA